MYFIIQQDWKYTSYELNSSKYFSTIDELKNYIKKRNPLISMWTNTETQNTTNPVTQLQNNNLETVYSEENNETSWTWNDENIISDLRKELFE
jgi:hypothetical protein